MLQDNIFHFRRDFRATYRDDWQMVDSGTEWIESDVEQTVCNITWCPDLQQVHMRSRDNMFLYTCIIMRICHVENMSILMEGATE